jgi:hypothetical protein
MEKSGISLGCDQHMVHCFQLQTIHLRQASHRHASHATQDGVRCPIVFRVQGPNVMAHQADSTILTQQIVLMLITATCFSLNTKHHTKSEKYPQDSYDIITVF